MVGLGIEKECEGGWGRGIVGVLGSVVVDVVDVVVVMATTYGTDRHVQFGSSGVVPFAIRYSSTRVPSCTSVSSPLYA